MHSTSARVSRVDMCCGRWRPPPPSAGAVVVELARLDEHGQPVRPRRERAGAVRLQLGGEELEMLPVNVGEQLWFIFRDLTSGSNTYAAAPELVSVSMSPRMFWIFTSSRSSCGTTRARTRQAASTGYHRSPLKSGRIFAPDQRFASSLSIRSSTALICRSCPWIPRRRPLSSSA